VDGNGRETEPVYDPATGEVVAETPLYTKDDVDRAVRAAGDNSTMVAASDTMASVTHRLRPRPCLRTPPKPPSGRACVLPGPWPTKGAVRSAPCSAECTPRASRPSRGCTPLSLIPTYTSPRRESHEKRRW
jgi:hypothetical protein